MTTLAAAVHLTPSERRSAARPAPWVVARQQDRDYSWMASPTPLTPHELRARSEDALLALVAAAREADDPAAKETARRAWNDLVERDVDRVRLLVRTWRLPGKDVRVDAQDLDDAAQHA